MDILQIRDSAIHGRGIFATKAFREGEVIIDWNGCSEVLSDEQFRSLCDDERKCVSYIEGNLILFKAPARFVNHSCNPNTRGENGHDVALRYIAAGEEITVDYLAEQVPGLSFQCNCGSNRCGGFLTLPQRR